jgi:hypothetical protein
MCVESQGSVFYVMACNISTKKLYKLGSNSDIITGIIIIILYIVRFEVSTAVTSFLL